MPTSTRTGVSNGDNPVTHDFTDLDVAIADAVHRVHKAETEMDMLESPISVERFDLANGRWYQPTVQWWEENGDADDCPVFPSVTTIDQVIDKGIGFHKWLGNEPSYKDAMAYARERAEIGTFVHELSRQLMMGIELDFNTPSYSEATEKFTDISSEVIKYLLSFEAFWEEYQPEPLASEVFLFSLSRFKNGKYKFPFAGTADLPCVIRNKKTNRKERWMIDLKTGNPYKQHQLQLTAYTMLWNDIFPKYKIKKQACLYVKSSWRNINKPTYGFKEYKFIPTVWKHAYNTQQWFESDARGNAPKPRWDMVLPDKLNLYKEDK